MPNRAHPVVCIPMKLPRDACAADSGVGLQQKEESDVNDLIDRLEEVGQHQVTVIKWYNCTAALVQHSQIPLFFAADATPS